MRKLRCIILLISTLSSSAFGQSSPTQPITWTQAAESVCQQLETAAKDYQQQNLETARVAAVMAYFQNYDINIEPAARVSFPQAHIFDIEQQFNKINKNMVENPTAIQIDAINQQTSTLCQIITADGVTMQQNNIKPPTYQVD